MMQIGTKKSGREGSQTNNNNNNTTTVWQAGRENENETNMPNSGLQPQQQNHHGKRGRLCVSSLDVYTWVEKY
jgi:hypothetical protein